MRLVDADKLKKSVLDLPNCYNGFSDTYDKARIIGVIDEQPTIKPHIKCKGCINHEVDDFGYWCNKWGAPCSEEGFCYLAKG